MFAIQKAASPDSDSSDPGVEDATPLHKGEKETKKRKSVEKSESSETKETKRRSKGEKENGDEKV